MGKYDESKIRDYYERSTTRAQAERYSYERSWFQNVLYFAGIQWIVYSAGTRKWKPRKIAKWVPRPVTNKFASVATSMIQVLSQREPSVSARSATDNPDDIAAAAIADIALPVILKEAGAKEARSLAASWLTLTGNVILHPCYDNDPMYGTTFVQHMLCQACGKTFAPDDETQNPQAPSGSIPSGTAIPPTGLMPEMGQGQEPMGSVSMCPNCGSPNVTQASEGVGEELPKGSLKIEVFSPFETYFDLEGKLWSDQQQIMTRRRYPIDVIRRKFDRFDLEPDNNSNVGGAIGLNLLRAIAYAAGNSVYGTGIASGRSLGDDQNITVDCQWVRPCTDFPEGLVTYWANNEIINTDTVKDGIPYHDKEGKPLWPWHLVKFDEVPGRSMGKTPLDDVAPKQEQRNKLESLIQLIITRAANPVWLIGKNTGVTEITGEPGQIIEGNWLMDPRMKPERVPGENIPTSLIAWLEKIDSDINDVAGIFEVLKGSAPPGVTAGTALRLLLERAMTRYTPVADRYEAAWQNVCQDLLCIAQENWVDERIAKIAGPGKTWEIKRFNKTNISGAIDVIVEAGSSVPKSQVGEQALIQDLITMQLINPMNPEIQYKILQRFGSTDLLGDTDNNIKAAQRENWNFQNQEMQPEFDLLIDSHMVHAMIHKQLALGSDWADWPEPKKQLWRQHIMQHMMAAAPPMGATAQPGAEGSQGGDSAGPTTPGNEGMPPDITEAPPAGGIM